MLCCAVLKQISERAVETTEMLTLTMLLMTFMFPVELFSISGVFSPGRWMLFLFIIDA